MVKGTEGRRYWCIARTLWRMLVRRREEKKGKGNRRTLRMFRGRDGGVGVRPFVRL